MNLDNILTHFWFFKQTSPGASEAWRLCVFFAASTSNTDDTGLWIAKTNSLKKQDVSGGNVRDVMNKRDVNWWKEITCNFNLLSRFNYDGFWNQKHVTVGLHLVLNKELIWIKMNGNTRKVCKIENGSGSYRIVNFSWANNYSMVWCLVWHENFKFKRILRRDSTFYIDKKISIWFSQVSVVWKWKNSRVKNIYTLFLYQPVKLDPRLAA